MSRPSKVQSLNPHKDSDSQDGPWVGGDLRGKSYSQAPQRSDSAGTDGCGQDTEVTFPLLTAALSQETI